MEVIKMKRIATAYIAMNLRRCAACWEFKKLLPLVFIASALSGIGLHIAGHGTNHEVWHNWAVAHVITSLLFLISGFSHMKAHYAWYKSLFQNGIGKKSRITFVLSGIYTLTTVSGIMLLGVEGANSAIGLWHYRVGLLLIVFSIIHIGKRIRRRSRPTHL